MKINTILSKLGINKVKYNHEIFKITDSSSECYKNSIFFAIKGYKVDGHSKISEAIENGAKTIVCCDKQDEIEEINYIYCSNTKRLLALFLHAYYHNIVDNLYLIGVIGTNGKTTTTTLIHNYLLSVNKKSMLIGTLGCYTANNYHKHDNTTPKITEIYKYFISARENKIKYVCMELSSIGIEELRVLGIPFKILIFTNFTEDHLDYHLTMDKYLNAKSIPFIKLSNNSYSLINYDDYNYHNIVKHNESKIISYSINNNSMYKANDIILKKNGSEFVCNGNKYSTNMIGLFNIYNMLPLIVINDILGIDNNRLINYLHSYNYIPGRMNLIEYNNRNIIIDYAHTEDAVKNVILEVSKVTCNNIYVIFGCGGNREKEKRSKIGYLLSTLNCIPIITSDNPRFENPNEIINEIIKGATKPLLSIENRNDAINYALNNLEDGDYLLILGKGSEDYIDIMGKKEKYSDMKVVQDWISKH